LAVLLAVIALLVVGLGWFVVQNWTSTPAELRAESRVEFLELYTPTYLRIAGYVIMGIRAALRLRGSGDGW